MSYFTLSVILFKSMKFEVNHKIDNTRNRGHDAAVGGTKAPLRNFSVSDILNLAEVYLKYFESHLYLIGVATAKLWQHLSNMNLICHR